MVGHSPGAECNFCSFSWLKVKATLMSRVNLRNNFSIFAPDFQDSPLRGSWMPGSGCRVVARFHVPFQDKDGNRTCFGTAGFCGGRFPCRRVPFSSTERYESVSRLAVKCLLHMTKDYL